LTWQIKWKDSARKELRSIDHQYQKKITRYLTKISYDSPRLFGKSLSGNFAGLWRYRVEDYRIICQIDDQQITILVLAVGHRKEVYI